MKQISRMIPTTKQDQRLSNVLTLRDGQLLTGKVKKFFPGNKALIQLSGHQLVAQLDASLQANQNYLMQVKGTSPSIQLQVMQQQAVHSFDDAALMLLNLTGEKSTQANQTLLADMLKAQLPLQPQRVPSLIQLAKNNHVPNRQQILSEMVQRQLPLNQDVFNAIHQRINQPISFTNTIGQVQSQLNQARPTIESIQLNKQLDLLSSKSVSSQNLLDTLVVQVLKEVGRGSSTTFQLLQKAGLFQNVTFQEWSNTWSNWASQHNIQFSTSSSPTSLPPLPYNMTVDNLTNAMTQLGKQQIPLQERSLQSLNVLMQHLNTLVHSAPNQHQQSLLINGIQSDTWSRIGEGLPNQMKSAFQQLQSLLTNQSWNQAQQFLQTTEGQQLLNQLNSILSSQLTTSEQRGLSFWQTMIGQHSTNQQHFSVEQMKHFIQMTQVDSGVNRDYPTLQSLIHSVQSQMNSPGLNESLQQLNQMIHAMHLSQVDSPNRDWISFTVQFPKDLLGLNQDLFMEFEGKKQEDGSVHPKQCRVLFYLELPHLKETIIDMHVQNGHVDLTVFHAFPDQLKKLASPFVSTLSDNLTNQDYTSVQVQFKPIHNQATQTQTESNPTSYEWRQGVDFRI
ncbi:hypothetical protein [Tenuibacillus multivorans]|uniref:Hook-length control protein FliK n=1 Tax=Tenuibacillus multivorans TaxID=237069 RepID=A0A1G9Y0A8_9BACI|nr:hypothetical protein [Tenuibacillus multivorans]GEL75894.1 hypothetical protein TMU01_01290 [Tenuibacillus multivorans]SDN02477.1 hypothetical protein SAMN05216498_1187 [Tenuibacillus multivorans]